MQLVDKNGNVFGAGIEITGPDGKPKTTGGGGGGSPTGSAGGDLSGTYPNPGVQWNNGLSTYNTYYYPLTNPDGFITSSALGPYLTAATAATTYQPILVSGTNIKTINSTSLLGSGNITTNPRTLTSINGSNLTGTANQISASVLIPANTISTNNTIYIKNLLKKTAGSTTSTGRIYINTSNSLTGATLLATAAQMNAATYHQRFDRNLFFDGTNLNVFIPTTASSSDFTVGGITLVPFNPATDYYLIFAVQNSTTTPDNLGWRRVIIQIYD
jgi:hypothetical protein